MVAVEAVEMTRVLSVIAVAAALLASLYAYNRFYLPEQTAALRACWAVKFMMSKMPVNAPMPWTWEDAEHIGHALVACQDAGHLPRTRPGA